MAETKTDIDIDLNKIDEIVSRYPDKRFALMGVLQDLQEEYGYLPREALKRVSDKMEIPMARIIGLATFYKAMSLTPRGKHTIRVCLGTACHLRGGKRIANTLKKELNLEEENTTADKLFTLETVHCVGACALAPVIMIDDKYYAKMTPDSVRGVLDEYRKEDLS